MATFLMILPICLALSITAYRQRRDRREDGPDSIEFQATRSSRAAAYVDTVVLGALRSLHG